MDPKSETISEFLKTVTTRDCLLLGNSGLLKYVEMIWLRNSKLPPVYHALALVKFRRTITYVYASLTISRKVVWSEILNFIGVVKHRV